MPLPRDIIYTLSDSKHPSCCTGKVRRGGVTLPEVIGDTQESNGPGAAGRRHNNQQLRGDVEDPGGYCLYQLRVFSTFTCVRDTSVVFGRAWNFSANINTLDLLSIKYIFYSFLCEKLQCVRVDINLLELMFYCM